MNIYFTIVLSLIISFAITWIIVPKIVKVAKVKNLFDIPNHRSAAKKIVPRLGGVAVFAGFRISQIITVNSIESPDLGFLSLGVIAMFFIGLKDDLIGAPVRLKLIIQILVAAYLVIVGHYHLTSFHGLLGVNELPEYIATILSVMIIVLIVNAVNLIDGIDGLASGIGILIAVIYGVWFFHIGDIVYSLTCFCLMGSLIAFFVYNVFGKSNKIFLGDTGSLILGIIIAILTMQFLNTESLNNGQHIGYPALALAILIFPVIDTLRVFTIRILHGKSPFSPDMNHIHHHVLKLTNNHLKASLFIIAANILIVIMAFNLIDILGNNVLFIAILILGLMLSQIPIFIYRHRNRVLHSNSKETILALSVLIKKLKKQE